MGAVGAMAAQPLATEVVLDTVKGPVVRLTTIQPIPTAVLAVQERHQGVKAEYNQRTLTQALDQVEVAAV
jgi:hypothetical protein